MSAFLPADPLLLRVERAVERLEAGATGDQVEDALVDVKEEAGRRDGPHVQPGSQQNELAARQLAREAACFANSVTGGALIVGIADDGTPIGTDLDTGWLRDRILELTDRAILPVVSARRIRGVRCLTIRVSPADEPVQVGGRLVMRVERQCIDVPAAEWGRRRRELGLIDWSRDPSDRSIDDIDPLVLAQARRFLRESSDPAAIDLAASADRPLLERLEVLLSDDQLTAAGAVLLCPLERPAIDFIRREAAGADATHRVGTGGRALLEDLAEIEAIMRATVTLTSARGDLAVGQEPRLPRRARREAIVNAIAHRDWGPSDPVTVELIGNNLTVSSPGGLFGGVTPDNIITHPSQRRSPHLVDVLAKLRLAEREAVGVDRMFRDMLSGGHPAPEIIDHGHRVVVTLLGDVDDHDLQQLVGAIAEVEPRSDLNTLLLLDAIRRRGWLDVTTAAAAMQRTAGQAEHAVQAVARLSSRSGRTIVVEHSRRSGAPMWTLNHANPDLGLTAFAPEERRSILRDFAEHRGRLTTTEAMACTGVSRPTAISDVERLVDDGVLAERGAGPTRHFVPVER